MFEAVVMEILGQSGCRMTGRLDSLSAAQAQHALEDLVAAGQRTLVVDLAELRYVSSAGLRVFLMAQKLLRKVGGRVIVYQAQEAVRQIFHLSGFLSLFELAASQDELAALLAGQAGGAQSRRLEVEGLALELIERPGPPARLTVLGSQDKLAQAAYGPEDMLAMPAGPGLFGAGLGCFGESFEDCRDFFGEALIIEGSLFYQPAVARAGVDFVLNLQDGGGVSYNFLHAFTFPGPFQALAAFESLDGLVELDRLAGALHQATGSPALGLVMLAESKGLWGMHLKRSPVLTNQPGQGRSIFDPQLFQEWMHFPVEPGEAGRVFVGVGLSVASRAQAPASLGPLLPTDADIHLHAAIFEKGPLAKKPEQLSDELRRVISEMEAHKVQHLLGRSRVAAGLVGLVALEG